LAQNRDQFAFVFAALRERLRTDAGAQGDFLAVSELAAAWGVSATPVREALARLAGEGLIEDRPGHGYFAWRLDARDLSDLYRAQETLLLAALDHLVRQAGEPAAASAGLAAPAEPALDPLSAANSDVEGPLFWEALTGRVARAAGYRFFRNELQRLADRLAPARRIEPRLQLEDAQALDDLADAVNRRDWQTLRANIPPFFTRRRAAAATIIDKLRTA
jgi:DNA-binding FadR family transcriptional regulator